MNAEKLNEIIEICEGVSNGDIYLEDSVIRDIYYLALELRSEVSI